MKKENVSYYYEGITPDGDSYVFAEKVLQDYLKLFPKNACYKWVFQNRNDKLITKLIVGSSVTEDLEFEGAGKNFKSSIQAVVGKIEEYLIECELRHRELLKEKKNGSKAIKGVIEVR